MTNTTVNTLNFKQAEAIAISRIAEKLGLNVGHGVEWDSPKKDYNQYAEECLLNGLKVLIANNALAIGSEHKELQHQSQVKALESKMADMKAEHEFDMAKILEQLEAIQ